jgi:hypothetical protein
MIKKPGKVLDFKEYLKRNPPKWDTVFTLQLFKAHNGDEYAYSMNKNKKHTLKDEFIAHALNLAVQDILAYSGSPEEILELAQEIEDRLGFTQDEE